jgi:hypothetical protein
MASDVLSVVIFVSDLSLNWFINEGVRVITMALFKHCSALRDPFHRNIALITTMSKRWVTSREYYFTGLPELLPRRITAAGMRELNADLIHRTSL